MIGRIVAAAVVLTFTAPAQAAEFFLKAKAEFADGTKKDFACERAAGAKNTKLTEGNLPSSKNAFRNYSFQCMDGTDFFGLSIKIPSKSDIVKARFAPYDAVTKTWGDMTTPTFTLKAKTAGKEMHIHSFKGTPQHFKAAGTKLTIKSFKEEKAGAQTFHVVSGEGTGDFEDKKMGNMTGKAGKLTLSFNLRPEFKPSPY